MVLNLFGVVPSESDENHGPRAMYIHTQTCKHAQGIHPKAGIDLPYRSLCQVAVQTLLPWQILVHCLSKEAEIILLPYTSPSQWSISKILRCLFQSVENVSLLIKCQM